MRRYHIWCEDCDYRAVFTDDFTARVARADHIETAKHRVFIYEPRLIGERIRLLKSL